MDHPADNAEQIAFWNGPAGEMWVARQEDLDASMAPFTARLIDALGLAPGERVLDVGCGCGDLALAAADAGARVVGIDVSEPMLARARARALGRAELSFVCGDASRHTFPTRFDTLLSRFGTLFFADPGTAFRNLLAAVRPGGRLAFLAWRDVAHNPWVRVPLGALRPLLPPAPARDPHAPGPFAFADRERVVSLLHGAGWGNARAEALTLPLTLGRDLGEALRFALELGPQARALATLAADEREAARAAVARALAEHLTDEGVVLEGSCWLVRAERP
jgi:SAM-dependent methyltransferase